MPSRKAPRGDRGGPFRGVILGVATALFSVLGAVMAGFVVHKAFSALTSPAEELAAPGVSSDESETPPPVAPWHMPASPALTPDASPATAPLATARSDDPMRPPVPLGALKPSAQPPVAVVSSPPSREREPEPSPASAPKTTPKAVPVSEPPKREVRHALEDLRARKRVLKLPEAGKSGPAPTEIAKILVDAADECDLSISTPEAAPGGGRLVLERADADGVRTWTLLSQGSGPLGPGKPQPVGLFSLKDQSLGYAWKSSLAGGWTGNLQFCLLRVQASGETEQCSLYTPMEAEETFKLDTEKGTWSVPIKLSPGPFPDVQSVRMDLKLTTDLQHTIQPESAWKSGEKGIVRVFAEGGEGGADKDNSALEIEARLDFSGSATTLAFKLWAVPKEVKPDGTVADRKRTAVSRRWFDQQQKTIAKKKAAKESEQRKVTREMNQLKGLAERTPSGLGSSRVPSPILGRGTAEDAAMARAQQQQAYQSAMASQAVANARQRYSQLQTQDEANKSLIAAWDSQILWNARMVRLCDALANKAKLHVSVYVPVEDGKVEIFRTPGMVGEEGKP